MRLYDVVNDLRGANDLSKMRPDLVKDFTERILAWRREKGMSGYLTIYE